MWTECGNSPADRIITGPSLNRPVSIQSCNLLFLHTLINSHRGHSCHGMYSTPTHGGMCISTSVKAEKTQFPVFLRYGASPDTDAKELARISHRVGSEAAQGGVMAGVRDRGPRRHSRHYVEQPDRANASQRAALGGRSSERVRNPGWQDVEKVLPWTFSTTKPENAISRFLHFQ